MDCVFVHICVWIMQHRTDHRQDMMSVWCCVWVFNNNKIIDCCITRIRVFVLLVLKDGAHSFDYFDYCIYRKQGLLLKRL